VQLPPIVIDIVVAVIAVAVLANSFARVVEVRWPHALELGMVQGFALGIALARLGPPAQLGVHVFARFALGALLASGLIVALLIAARGALRPRPET
jgi:hypothetical protein